MNSVDDQQLVAEHGATQRGVWSKADLQALLAERHPAAFTRRVDALLASGALRRFVRGFYVSAQFDLPTLSQRLAPDSYISFGTVLAEHLVIGPKPDRQVIACRTGKPRRYRAHGHEILHLHLAAHLDFGHAPRDGVQFADPEKAVLDVLYFHLRGRTQPFDVYGDIDVSRLDRRRLLRYLDRYRNPKFTAFARRVLAA